MDAKHTPGPWSICFDGQLDGADGTRVLFLPFDSYKEFNDLQPTIKANLRLIAAAPDLLAALEQAAEWLEGSALHLGDIRATIAKAKGD